MKILYQSITFYQIRNYTKSSNRLTCLRKADFTLMGFKMSLGILQAGTLEWVGFLLQLGFGFISPTDFFGPISS